MILANFGDYSLVKLNPYSTVRIGNKVYRGALELQRAIHRLSARSRHAPDVVRRKHGGGGAGEDQLPAIVVPGNAAGRIGNLGDVAGAGGAANIDGRMQVVVADLRRLCYYCDLRAIVRPGDVSNVVEGRAPPCAIRAVHAHHVQAGLIVLYHGVDVTERVFNARISEKRKAHAVRRDGG